MRGSPPAFLILHLIILTSNLGLIWLLWLSRFRPITWWERMAAWFLLLVLLTNASLSVYLVVQ